MIIDKDYQIVDVNNTFMRTTGQNRQEVIGRRCFEATHRYDAPCSEFGHDCRLRTVFDSGEASSHKQVYIDANGHHVHVDVLLSPMKDEDGTS